MAAISVRWDDAGVPILRIGLAALVNWSELEAVKRSYNRAGFPEQWGVLVDVSQAGDLLNISVLRLARLMRETPAGACAFAVFGARQRVRMMAVQVPRLFPSLESRFLVADSEAEARAWLLERLGPSDG